MDVVGPIPKSFSSEIIDLLTRSQHEEYGLRQLITTWTEEETEVLQRIRDISAIIQNMETLLPSVETEKDKANIEAAKKKMVKVLESSKKRQSQLVDEIFYLNRLLGVHSLESASRKRKFDGST